jgi:hypothetical protein
LLLHLLKRDRELLLALRRLAGLERGHELDRVAQLLDLDAQPVPRLRVDPRERAAGLLTLRQRLSSCADAKSSSGSPARPLSLQRPASIQPTRSSMSRRSRAEPSASSTCA